MPNLRLSIEPAAKVFAIKKENNSVIWEHDKIHLISISYGFLFAKMQFVDMNGWYFECNLEPSDLKCTIFKIHDKIYTLYELYLEACKSEAVIKQEEDKKADKENAWLRCMAEGHEKKLYEYINTPHFDWAGNPIFGD